MSDEGRLITGRYRLHERIGSGAMGIVWRATDERLQRTVAVKQLLLQPGYTAAETQEARERSMREGRIAARLQHHNAIAVFDVAEDDGQPVLVMEYLPSHSLGALIAERGVLPPLEVARIGAQIAGALAAAHAAGIVHRDLKPGNILLGDSGDAKITDFGISRAVGDVSVTKSGILAGTPAYLSPEVALGQDPSAASDVFSLGSTLYAAIQGHPPFGVDDNAISLLHRVSRGHVEPPPHGGPLTPALMQLLRPDPAERPSMAQAQALLQSVTEGRPVASPPVSSYRPAAAAASGRAQSGGSGSVNPPTRVGAIPAATPVATGSAQRNRRLISIAAIVVAIIVGPLVANAFSGTSASRSQEKSGQSTAPTTPPATSTNNEPEPTEPATSTQTSTATTTTSTSEETEESEESEEPVPKVTKDEIGAMVEKYFQLVPDKLDESWELLGPVLKSLGREKYEEFWGGIKDVEIVSGPRVVSRDKVVLTLVYTKEDGTEIKESHKLGIIIDDGQPLINTDSQT